MADPATSAIDCRVPVADLRNAPQRYAGEATAAQCAALAGRFGLPEVQALSWEVETAPWRGGVRLSGRVQGRVVQECVVTLDPVPGAIDETFDRGFLPFADLYADDSPGSEHEIVEDPDLGDVPEPLTDPLDIGEVVAEEFGIALDPYPRTEGLEETGYTAQPEGAEPLTDAAVKPFAGLADLAKRMEGPKSGD